MTSVAVMGIYTDLSSVDCAVERLRDAGFRSSEISLLLPENLGSHQFDGDKADQPHAGSAAASGVAAPGAGLDWLGDLEVLALAGIGPALAAGPIMDVLVRAGKTADGVTDGLVGFGIPEHEAKCYQGRIREGGILLSLHVDESTTTTQGRTLLEETGAQQIAAGRGYSKMV